MARIGQLERFAIVAIYLIVFWAILPLVLLTLGRALDDSLRLAPLPTTWGWPLLLVGIALVAWAALWLRIRGQGLPISALPPPHLVVSGPYGIVRHPMYLGYNVALVGLALVLGSWGLLVVGGPLFLVCWLVYALVEERGLLRRFGAEYRTYQSDVALWPRPPLYRIVQVLVAARVLPVTVEGRSHLPRGAYVVVANHACYLDPVFLTQITWRRIRFLATAESFRSRLFGWLLLRAGAIPLRRYARDVVAARALVRHLSWGEIAGMFVEGERAPLGVYQGTLPHVADVISRLGVPVVPVGICGSYDAGPRWSGVLRRRPVTLRIGPPIALTGRDPTQAIDAAIRALLAAYVPRVHLEGLPHEQLSRVLWACPRCLDETYWNAAFLRCGRCGAHYAPTAEGLLVDQEGQTDTLAALGERLVASVASSQVTDLTCPAHGFYERAMVGLIQPVVPVGAGLLRITRTSLTFTPNAAQLPASGLVIPLHQIRSVTTERADTLQVATLAAMWQFKPETMSVFRLRHFILAWTASRAERLMGVPSSPRVSLR